jgi:Bacterial PH domain
VLGVAAWSTWRVLEWVNDLLVVTDKRIVTISGLVTRKVAMMPLSRVTDMTYDRSWSGRILGYGEFIVESAGQDQALSRINYIPRPDAAYRQIAELLFGKGEEEAAKPAEPAPVPETTTLPVYDPDATQPLYVVKERELVVRQPSPRPVPPPRPPDESSKNNRSSDGT